MPETRTATEGLVGLTASFYTIAVDAGVKKSLSYLPPASAVSLTLEERWWDWRTGTATSRWGA